MISDIGLRFCSALALNASTVASTHLYNNTTGFNLGGTKAYLHIQMVAALGTATHAKFDLQCHEDSSFSTGTRTVISSGDIAAAQLTANTIVFNAPLPDNIEQYMRVYATVTGTPGAGTFTAWIDNNPMAEAAISDS